MAYITVTTPIDVVAPDDGQLSLREAIALANGSPDASTIKFVLALGGHDFWCSPAANFRSPRTLRLMATATMIIARSHLTAG